MLDLNEQSLHNKFTALAIRRLAEIGFERATDLSCLPLLETIPFRTGNIELTISCLEKYEMWLSTANRAEEADKGLGAMILVEVQYLSNDDESNIYDLSVTVLMRQDDSILLAKATLLEILQESG